MATHFDEYERCAKSLGYIADRLDKNSPQYVALERAGWALAFVTMYHQREFESFLEQKGRGELSPDQRAELKKLGLE